MHFPTENLRSPAALARFLLTTVVGLALDLWTKSLAFSRLAAGVPKQYPNEHGRMQWVVFNREEEGHPFIPGWLHLRVTVNEGAVFGLGQGHRWLFVVISVAAIVFLTYLFATSNGRRFYQFVLGLLLAGVLGNMYDRFHYGYVRDMIYALPRWRVFPWIFNVADVLLCCGVGLIFVYSLVQMRQTGAHPAPVRPGDESEQAV
jgi:signal peptidase II